MTKKRALILLHTYFNELENKSDELEPIALLDDIGATSWEYAYQKMGGDAARIDVRGDNAVEKYLVYKNEFNRIFSKCYADSTDIWRVLK